MKNQNARECLCVANVSGVSERRAVDAVCVSAPVATNSISTVNL